MSADDSAGAGQGVDDLVTALGFEPATGVAGSGSPVAVNGTGGSAGPEVVPAMTVDDTAEVPAIRVVTPDAPDGTSTSNGNGNGSSSGPASGRTGSRVHEARKGASGGGGPDPSGARSGNGSSSPSADSGNGSAPDTGHGYRDLQYGGRPAGEPLRDGPGLRTRNRKPRDRTGRVISSDPGGVGFRPDGTRPSDGPANVTIPIVHADAHPSANGATPPAVAAPTVAGASSTNGAVASPPPPAGPPTMPTGAAGPGAPAPPATAAPSTNGGAHSARPSVVSASSPGAPAASEGNGAASARPRRAASTVSASSPAVSAATAASIAAGPVVGGPVASPPAPSPGDATIDAPAPVASRATTSRPPSVDPAASSSSSATARLGPARLDADVPPITAAGPPVLTPPPPPATTDASLGRASFNAGNARDLANDLAARVPILVEQGLRGRSKVRARKVRRVVRHIDPWSVLVFSVLFHLCVFTALLLSSVLVWNAAVAAGTIQNIENFIRQLGDYQTFTIDGGVVFRAAMIIAAVLTLASSVMAVLLTVVFNLISDLVGGIRVTVVEEETVKVDRRRSLNR